MRFVAIALVSALALSGCIKETANYASDEIVWDVAYLHDGPRVSISIQREIMKAGQRRTLLW